MTAGVLTDAYFE